MDSSLGVKSAWTHLWTRSVMNPKRNTAGENTAGRYFKSQQSFDRTTFGTPGRAGGAERVVAACLSHKVNQQLPSPSPPPTAGRQEKRKTTSHTFKIKASCFRLALDSSKDGKSQINIIYTECTLTQ